MCSPGVGFSFRNRNWMEKFLCFVTATEIAFISNMIVSQLKRCYVTADISPRDLSSLLLIFYFFFYWYQWIVLWMWKRLVSRNWKGDIKLSSLSLFLSVCPRPRVIHSLENYNSTVFRIYMNKKKKKKKNRLHSNIDNVMATQCEWYETCSSNEMAFIRVHWKAFDWNSPADRENLQLSRQLIFFNPIWQHSIFWCV